MASGLKQQCPNDLCKMTKERVVQRQERGGLVTGKTNKGQAPRKDDDILHYKELSPRLPCTSSSFSHRNRSTGRAATIARSMGMRRPGLGSSVISLFIYFYFLT